MNFKSCLSGANSEGAGSKLGLVTLTRNRLLQFRDDECGAMIVLALLCFIGMMAGAGMAIDFMRFENTRSRMQSTLDRSLLAAASLNQELDPTDVVEDYFAKSGLQNYDLNVTVDEGLNYKTVSATVSSTVDNMFLNLIGIENMSALSAGVAEERIQNVEISMVLDISGSMGSYSRLSNLKTAAKDFSETLLDASDDGQVSISVVPYNANVNVGSRLIQEYNASTEHTSSHCLRFDDDDFDTTSLSTSQSLERVAHFDFSTSSSTSPIGDPWCQTGDDLGILALSTSESALDARIDALVADGNTAADMGMKWGVALLDPASQGVVTNMIATGDISSGLAGRPVSYDNNETMKVLILMTDGSNTTQYDIKQSRKSGFSNVWIDSSASTSETDKYSVYVPEYEEYYYPHNGSWNDAALGDGGGVTVEVVCGWTQVLKNNGKWKWKWKCWEEETSTGDGSTAVNMTYPELWAAFSTRYVADYFYGWSNSYYYDYYYSYETIVGGTSSDSRLLDVCSAAKSAGITIFTIGFEAPTHGEDVMEACASSSAHYYDVDGLEIGEAFNAIAATIQKLKLVE